jgi:hypothetical protein
MQVKYTIIGVSHKKGMSRNNKRYKYLEIDYKEDGKAATYKAFEFNMDNDLYARFADLKPGQEIIVTKEKPEGSQYWNWIDFKYPEAEKQVPNQSKLVPIPYDGDAKQVLIVRQSAIKASVDYHSAFSKDSGASMEDILNSAETIVNYVLTGEIQDEVIVPEPKVHPGKGFSDMPDDLDSDIPY